MRHKFAEQKPEPASIAFLISRSPKDRWLELILPSVLKKIDSPDAVLYILEVGGRSVRVLAFFAIYEIQPLGSVALANV